MKKCNKCDATIESNLKEHGQIIITDGKDMFCHFIYTFLTKIYESQRHERLEEQKRGRTRCVHEWEITAVKS